MAKARQEARKEVVEVVMKKTTDVKVTVLELTEEETAFLRVILQRIGGNYETSPRKFASSISGVLATSGVLNNDLVRKFERAIMPRDSNAKGAIYFDNDTI